MNTIWEYLVPKYYNKQVEELIQIDSLFILIKNPLLWVKKNYSQIYNLFKVIISYLLKKPVLRWNDYNIEGYLKFNQAIELYKLSKNIPKGSTIVEIGAYLGRSTCFIAEAIKKKNVKLISIDTFENQAMTEGLKETFKEYFQNIYEYRSMINIIRGFSYDVVKDWEHLKIDLLWIDADHSYEGCKKDIEDWLPLVKKNSYIVFHDYHKGSNNNVAKAVDEKIREEKLLKEKLIGHLMITKKR